MKDITEAKSLNLTSLYDLQVNVFERLAGYYRHKEDSEDMKDAFAREVAKAVMAIEACNLILPKYDQNDFRCIVKKVARRYYVKNLSYPLEFTPYAIKKQIIKYFFRNCQ